ncbi:MAG TPA: RlmE family RNA methyltransferase [Rhodospirillales bacterium]|nr:RlmE family RNA methyltransferase [Rhodospirillales bacterium]
MSKSPGSKSPGGGGRRLKTRVKTAKGRKISSTRWLKRQLNDPYVAEAGKRGLRSRAAFKLMELDARFHFLKPGARVVDLGAAPGGWTQVAAERVKAGDGEGRVIALDVSGMAPVKGARTLMRDFLDADVPDLIRQALEGPADVVLSDMAAPATGHAATDHLRIMALSEAAFDFARETLAGGGAFVCKVLQGGAEQRLLAKIKRLFKTVRHAKPPASRADSAEVYLVATGFKGE